LGVTLLLILLSQSVLNWNTTLYNNWVYGTPHTYQTDAFVGYEGSISKKSHFIALNNQGRVEVIEFPGNDAIHARIYFGPLLSGPNADLMFVTLKFVLYHAGQREMLVQVQGTSMLFMSHYGTFQPVSTDNFVTHRHRLCARGNRYDQASIRSVPIACLLLKSSAL
jgi:hypothetical protein